MTAAMAFFSIALTLNLTGVRLSICGSPILRPAAVRSFMERRLTMASVPIVRYYDHLRFVYEVESSMRELRRSTEGEGQGDDNNGTAEPNDTSRRASRNRIPAIRTAAPAWTPATVGQTGGWTAQKIPVTYFELP